MRTTLTASMITKQTVNIGRSHDGEHFLEHNVMFENLNPVSPGRHDNTCYQKPALWPLEFLEIIVFCDEKLCLSVNEAKPRGNLCVFPRCKRGVFCVPPRCLTSATREERSLRLAAST